MDFRTADKPDRNGKKYAIGEFAAVNKITARMLRHYDKIGLFRPSAVLENGYRCYCSEQIPAVSLIKKYRSCGFSLAEISKLLRADEKQIAAFAQKKRRQLAAQDSFQNEALKSLLILSGDNLSPLPNDYIISYTQQPERLLCTGAVSVCESGIEKSFEELYAAAETARMHPAGLPMLLSDLQDENTPYRAAVPVPQGTSLAGFASVSLDSGWYISVLHHGAYDDIGAGYDRLLCHAQELNRQLDPLFAERYLLDCTHAADPAEYITEISARIIPAYSA